MLFRSACWQREMYFCISASLFPAKKSVTVFDTVAVAVSGNTMASRLIFISFAYRETPEQILLRKERDMALWKAMEVLSNTQFRRLILYADGMSFREIAALEGKDFSSIAESINAAKKKVRNFL